MTSNTVNAVSTDNLSTALNSAQFVPMDSVKAIKPSTGHYFAKLIKKGENSKLPESLAIEVPFPHSLAAYMAQAGLVDYLTEAMQALQDNYLKARAASGVVQVQYEELTPANLAQFYADSAANGGIGQLSEERIIGWFEASARDMLIVALADRLGISETATDADVKRMEQIANQTRDNLKKLSSKKPVHFDERITKALNWALDVTESGDNMTARLRNRLNTPNVDQVNMADALGF